MSKISFRVSLKAIDYSDKDYDVFNLGESRTVELRELIELIEKSIGKEAVIEALPEQPGDVPVTYADISKAKSLLGYNPTTQIEDGIAEICRMVQINPDGLIKSQATKFNSQPTDPTSKFR